jgi:hypothetical protein
MTSIVMNMGRYEVEPDATQHDSQSDREIQSIRERELAVISELPAKKHWEGIADAGLVDVDIKAFLEKMYRQNG